MGPDKYVELSREPLSDSDIVHIKISVGALKLIAMGLSHGAPEAPHGEIRRDVFNDMKTVLNQTSHSWMEANNLVFYP